MASELATRIRQARKEAGLTREQVAAELGVSLGTVVRLETGRTKRVAVDTVMRIAAVTGQPLGYFFVLEPTEDAADAEAAV